MSVAMLCIELEKKMGLNPPTYPPGPTYHCGGSLTIPANAWAQWCSTPSAIAYGRNFSNVVGGITLRRSASTRFMNSWKPSTAICVRAPFNVLADMTRANNHQISADSGTQTTTNPPELKKLAHPRYWQIPNGARIATAMPMLYPLADSGSSR